MVGARGHSGALSPRRHTGGARFNLISIGGECQSLPLSLPHPLSLTHLFPLDLSKRLKVEHAPHDAVTSCPGSGRKSWKRDVRQMSSYEFTALIVAEQIIIQSVKVEVFPAHFILPILIMIIRITIINSI